MSRIEKDFLGEKQIFKQSLYGIHSVRARENFPDNTPIHAEWYMAIGQIKLAYYLTYTNFKNSLNKKTGNNLIPFFDDSIIEALIESAEEIAEGKYFQHFIVPAIQGGAGSSINMNVNEIIANVALTKLDLDPGDYDTIDPLEHANIFQSTNDIIPSSLKMASIKLLVELEDKINGLKLDIEKLEKQSRNKLRIAYTQMEQTAPSSYAILFDSYKEALSRDKLRVSKSIERLNTLNLGGGEIGTGMSVPQFFIMEVIPTLQKLTNLPVKKDENMTDSTNNLDSLVEVHSILKTHAVNLEKMVSDIRLLSSDLIGSKEIRIPQKQTGSIVMPEKGNPVIPEFVISVAHKIYANDMLVCSLSAQGCLDMNPYLPVIGNAILDSIKLLIAANKTLKENMFEGLTINNDLAEDRLYHSSAVATALTPYIGHIKASKLAKEIQKSGKDIFRVNSKLKLIDPDKLEKILSTQNILKLGFTLNDLKDFGE